MKLGIGKKLGLSFGTIIVLMAISGSIVLLNAMRVDRAVTRTVEQSFPARLGILQLTNHVGESITALRGYMLVGNEQDKSRRAQSWAMIDQRMSQFKDAGQSAMDENERKHWQTIRDELEQLKQAQQRVEDIAQTDENIEAYHVLMTEAMPLVKQMRQRLDTLINMEAAIDPTLPRRELLTALADSRGTFVGSLAQIRAYLLSGKEAFAESFKREWDLNEQALERVNAGRSLFQGEQSENWDRYLALRQKFHPLVSRMFSLRRAQDWNKAVHLLNTEAMPRVDRIREAMRALEEIAQHRVIEDTQVTIAARESLTLALAVTMGVAIVIAGVVAVLLSRQIVGAVQSLVERAREIADGNLAGEKIRVSSRDEIGELADTFNQMTDGLRDLTGRISAVSGNIDTASTQILAATRQQAAGTREQAASVQQVFSTMKELTQSGEQINGQAKTVASDAEATNSATSSGREVAQQANESMVRIREQIDQVAENIVTVSERTQSIGEIVGTVNDIAEQSNLLALNASIEAVSAGEQGGRFSVVANEMKNLADQAKDCTVQVRDLLGEIQKGINTSVMLTEEAVKRSDAGREQADVTLETIESLGTTTTRSVETFQQIAAGAAQQQVGFDQVTKGMSNITEATEQITSGTDQLESAASALSELSKELQSAVERYHV